MTLLQAVAVAAMCSVALGDVTRDQNGFTVVVPEADSRVVHVSWSRGSDTTGDGSITKPYRTLEKGYERIRSGYPDQLLLRRGDAWPVGSITLSKSGRSPDEPMVLGAYTDVNGPTARPKLRAPTSDTAIRRRYGTNAGRVDNIFILGIEIDGQNGSSIQTGILWADTEPSNAAQATDTLWIEDCYLHNLGSGMVFIRGGGAHTNITLRRNHIVDINGNTRAAGIFMDHCAHVLIEENLIDSINWGQAGIDQANPIYLDSPSGSNSGAGSGVHDATVRGNIVARHDGVGISHRNCYPLMEDNLVILAGFGIYAGHGEAQDGSGRPTLVRNNVITQGVNNENNQRPAWGFEINSNYDATFDGNIVYTSANTSGGAAFHMRESMNGGWDNDVTFRNNIGFNWGRGGTYPGTSGLEVTGPFSGYERIVWEGNAISATSPAYSGLTMNLTPQAGQIVLSRLDFDANTYSSWLPGGQSLRLDPVTYNLPGWRDAIDGESVSQATPIDYADPGRSPAEYMSVIHRTPATTEGFLLALRQQSSTSYDPLLTSYAFNRFVRDGFARGCGRADLSPPYGILDMTDVLAFLTWYNAGDSRADLDWPLNEFDFADIVRFMTEFGRGCP